MTKIKILWVDDEIDLLKPHILFLENKNYDVTTCNNGRDAIEIFEENQFDVVFLDENMPGMSGLETLSEMKEKKSLIRIVKTAENEIFLDETGKKNGRGAYICPNSDCLSKAIKNKGLERSFKMGIPNEIYENLTKEMRIIENK